MEKRDSIDANPLIQLNESSVSLQTPNEGSLCCNLLCCFSSRGGGLSPGDWLKRFRKWFSKIRGSTENSVFNTILGIYAGKTQSIGALKECRINPAYKNSWRNDMEFFIPQLCSYLIDESKPNECRDCLFPILSQAASSDFYFSHRLYFFLQGYSMDMGLSDRTHLVMASLVQVIIDQSIYKKEEEMLYISKPQKLLKILKSLNLEALYDPVLKAGKDSKLEQMSKKHSNRLSEARQLIIAYNLLDDQSQSEEMREAILEGISARKINARDLVIYPFISRFKSRAGSEPKLIETDNAFLPFQETEDIGKSAYKSTPSFVSYLTTISHTIWKCDNKLETLKSELRQLNLKLPAAVYIPFVNEEIRKNIVLFMPPQEAKVFKTKTKAPYLIVIELYDPLEIINEPFYLEPDPIGDKILPAPPLPLIKRASKNIKQILPFQDIPVLGTMPRNMIFNQVPPKRMLHKDTMEENEEITIKNSKFPTPSTTVRANQLKNNILLTEGDKTCRAPNIKKDFRFLNDEHHELEFAERAGYSKVEDSKMPRMLIKMQTMSSLDLRAGLAENHPLEPALLDDSFLSPSLVENQDVKIVRKEETPGSTRLGTETKLFPESSEEAYTLDNIFGESFEDKSERIRENSPFGGLSSWSKLI